MEKKIAILQSNYIPWKGYFDVINSVDEFILYDDVQYTKNDWRNRNRIKTRSGAEWITIPIHQDCLSQKIKETRIADKLWGKRHWTTLNANYARSRYFKETSAMIKDLYLDGSSEYLCEVNFKFIETINTLLGINTKITRSCDYDYRGDRVERLVDLCRLTGTREYISGPAAKGYLDEELFRQENIKITWMDYSGYPEYNQLFPPFVHEVSIIDLIMNEGPNALRFMKSFKESE